MFDIDFTFIWTFINLAVLVVLMRIFLFKRVTAFMERRAKSIADELESARTKQQEASELREQFEDLLRKAKDQAEDIISHAKADAEAEGQRILREARNSAAAIIERSYKEAEDQKKSIIASARPQIIDMALAASSKIVRKNLDEQSNREYLDRLLNEEGIA